MFTIATKNEIYVSTDTIIRVIVGAGIVFALFFLIKKHAHK